MSEQAAPAVDTAAVTQPDPVQTTVLTSEGAPAPSTAEQTAAIDEAPKGGENTATMDWKVHLAEELKAEPSLSVFKTVNDLATGFINTNK